MERMEWLGMLAKQVLSQSLRANISETSLVPLGCPPKSYIARLIHLLITDAMLL
jgi:hypothetical protein